MERPVSYHNGVPWSPSKPGKAYRRFKKTLVVDSRDRIFSSTQNPGGTPKIVTNSFGDLLPLNNDYYVQLPNAYKNVYGVRLLTAEIPTSFYVFNSNTPLKSSLSLDPSKSNYYKNCIGGNPNGIMWVTYDDGINPATTAQVTLPNGNYSLTTPASPLSPTTTLQSALVTALTPLGGNWTVTVDPTTQKLTITVDAGDFTVYTSYDPVNNYVLPTNTFWGLGYILGFQKSPFNLTSSGGTLTGSYPVQVNPYNYILMELEFINKMDEGSLENNRSGSIDSVFAKIPLDANSFGYVFYSVNASYEARSVMTPPLNKLQVLHVKFRHHDGTLVNFNNVEHSFTLELELLDTNFDEWSSLETSLADPLALEGRRFNA
jgi:hypothetical protein